MAWCGAVWCGVAWGGVAWRVDNGSKTATLTRQRNGRPSERRTRRGPISHAHELRAHRNARAEKKHGPRGGQHDNKGRERGIPHEQQAEVNEHHVAVQHVGGAKNMKASSGRTCDRCTRRARNSHAHERRAGRSARAEQTNRTRGRTPLRERTGRAEGTYSMRIGPRRGAHATTTETLRDSSDVERTIVRHVWTSRRCVPCNRGQYYEL